MKSGNIRGIQYLFVLFVIFFTGCPEVENEIVCTKDGVSYKVNDTGLTALADVSFYSSELNILNTVNNKAVNIIDENAFAEFHCLEVARIPDSITKLSSKAFQGCSNLKAVYISSQIPPECGSKVFNHCDNLKEIRVPNGTIQSYLDDSEWAKYKSILCELDWPAVEKTVDGIKYTADFENKLWNVSGIDNITLENIIIKSDIDTWPVSVIAAECFAYCSNIKTLTIPDSIKIINNNSFNNCYNLKIVNLHCEQPPEISSGLFDMYNLEKIFVAENTSSLYRSSKEWAKYENIIFEYGWPEAVIEQDGLKYEADFVNQVWTVSASDYNSLSGNIIIPEIVKDWKVSSIKDDGFRNSKNITSVEVPKEITFIGDMAFSYCKNLEKIIFNSLIPVEIGKSIFSGSKQLKEIRIPDNSINQYLEIKKWNQYSQFLCEYSWPSSVIEKDGFKFTVDYKNKCWTVFSIDKSLAGDFIIPEFVETWPVTIIGDSAFRYCSMLTSVSLPKSISEICSYAFYECSSLKKIILNSSEPCFTDDNFLAACYNCLIEVPDNSIEKYRDSKYWKEYKRILKEASWPDLRKDVEGLFFIADYEEETWTLSTCGVYEGRVVIPSEIDGWPVTRVLKSFQSCDEITAIEFPETIKYIDSRCFYSNRSIKEIKFLSEQPLLLDSDFIENKLYSLSVIRVPDGTWKNYSKAKIWSKYKQKIYEESWPDPEVCLEDILYFSDNETKTFTAKSDNVYISGKITLKNEIQGWPVTRVAQNGFLECYNLEELTLPENLNEIGDNCFVDCRNLKNIYIYNSVPGKISNNVFSSTLKPIITVPAGCAENYQNAKNWTEYKEKIREPEWPEFEIKKDCFIFRANYFKKEWTLFTENDNSRTSITIPASFETWPVTVIGKKSFENFPKLETLIIPESVKLVNFLLNYEPSLKAIELKSAIPPEAGSDFKLIFGYDFEIRVPEGCAEVYRNSDAWKKYSKAICETGWPSRSVKYNGLSFEADYLNQCYVLRRADSVLTGSIVIPPEFSGWKVKTILSNAFKNCGEITSVEIPDYVNEIQHYAFINCNKLESLIMNSHQPPVLGFNNFRDSSEFSRILIPDSTYESYSKASRWNNYYTFLHEKSWPESRKTYNDMHFNFNYHTKVWTLYDAEDSLSGNIIIPAELDGWPVTILDRESFKDCIEIQQIEIPETIKKIYYSCFDNCEKLTTIIINNDNPIFLAPDFMNCYSKLESITVPTGSRKLYCEANRWKDFKEIIHEPGWPLPEVIDNQLVYKPDYDKGTVSVGALNSSIADNPVIKSSISGWPVTSIRKQGFFSCNSIETIYLPESIRVIESSAFGCCYSLKNINLPESLERIESDGFYDCPILKEVVLPASIKLLGSRVFRCCIALEKVKILNNNKIAIKNDIFERCFKLKEIRVPNGSAADFQSFDGWSNYKEKICEFDWPEVEIVDNLFKYKANYLTQEWTISQLNEMNIAELVIPSTCKGWPVVEIGQKGFISGTIKTIVLPESIKKINFQGLYNSELTKIIVNSSVPLIVGPSFLHKDNILEIRVPEGTVDKYRKAQGWNNFSEKIFEPDWPDARILQNGMEFNSDYLNQVCTLTKITSSVSGNCLIPEVVQGWNIEVISQNALNDINDINKITFPSTIKKIENNIFGSNLNQIEIIMQTENPPEVCSNSFDNVTTIRVPEGKVSLYRKNQYWQKYSAKICEIGWPEPVIVRDGFVFEADYIQKGWIVSCDKVNNSSTIEIPAALEGWPVLKTRNSAFSSNVNFVIVPESINYMNEQTFKNAINLKKIEFLSKNPINITSELFSGCLHLREIRVPDISVNSYKNHSGWNQFDSIIFGKNWNLEPIFINDVKYLPNFENSSYYAVDADQSLTGVIELEEIIEGWPVSQIGSNAFANCSKIESIVISENIKIIDDYAFPAQLTNVTFKSRSPILNVADSNIALLHTLQTIRVPANSRDNYINEKFWNNFASIICETNWPSPENIVGKLKFIADYSNKTISVSAANKDISGKIIIPQSYSIWPVNSISANGFYNCDQVQEIELAKTIDSIGESAFDSCSNLKILILHRENPIDLVDVILPESVESIRVSESSIAAYRTHSSWENYKTKICGFDWPAAVETHGYFNFYADYLNKTLSVGVADNSISGSFTLPYGNNGWNVTGITNSGFKNCINLESILIRDSIVSIGDYSFYSCSKLETLEIPESVTYIGKRFIDNCTNLKKLKMKAVIPPVVDENYLSVNQNPQMIISVPDDSVNAYRTAENWKNNKDRIIGYNWPKKIHIENGMKFTADYSTKEWIVSAQNTDISGEVIIPEQISGWNVREISKKAFENCNKITSVIIPDSVSIIHYSAFEGCSNVVKATLSNKIFSLSVFEKLNIIELSNSELNMSYDALSDCNHLEEIIIPDGSFGYYSSHNEWKDYKNLMREQSWAKRLAFQNNLKFVANYPEMSWTVYVSNLTEPGDVIIPSSIESMPVTVLGSLWGYSSNDNILSLKLPSTIEVIRNKSMDKFNMLTTLILERENPPTLEGYLSCDKLSYIQVPETSINKYKQADYWDYQLDEIIGIGWPERTLIENGLEFQVSYDDKNWSVKAADKSLTGDVIIPSKVKGWPVVEFVDGYDEDNNLQAFTNCSEITSITIPDTFNSICEEAFKNCNSLTTVKIPSTIKSIGRLAFYNCESLTNVILPEGLKVIEKLTFSHCLSLINLSLPVSIEKIENDAFEYCSSLTSLILPEKLKMIGSMAFRNLTNLNTIEVKSKVPPQNSGNFLFKCDSLTRIIVPAGKGKTYQNESGWDQYKYLISEPEWPVPIIVKDGLTYEADYVSKGWIVSANEYGVPVNVEIPSTVEGWPVIKVKNNAFLSSLRTLFIPDTIQIIEFDAFDNAVNLEKVEFESNVPLNIYNHLFSDCEKLKEIRVPDSSIDSYKNHSAWIYYKSRIYGKSWDIESVEIKGITYSPDFNNNSYYVSRGDQSLNGVVSIENTIKNKPVTRIGVNAFKKSYGISSIVVPVNVDTIDDDAFHSNLDNITLKSSIPMTHVASSNITVFNNFQTIRVPDGSSTEYQKANFWKNYSSIICEKSWPQPESFDEYFKYNADYLTLSISISAKHKYINGDLVIPESFAGWPVKSISEKGFFECSNIQKIIIPASVTSIGKSAFDSCTALTTIVLENGSPIDLIEITLPDSLENIRVPESSIEVYRQHKNWKNYKSKICGFDWPESVEIQDSFKLYADYINKTWSVSAVDSSISGIIVIPSSYKGWNVTTISDYGFKNCLDIETIKIPESIVAIGDYAFSSCTKIETLKIPESVSSIGRQFINNCINIVKVIMIAEVPPYINSNNLSSSQISNMVISVPDNCVEAYRSAVSWKDFKDIITGYNWPEKEYRQDKLKFIADYSKKEWRVYAENKDIAGEVIIPEQFMGWNVSSIATCAFNNCSKVTSIIIPDSVISIYDEAFDGCSALRKLVLPQNLVKLCSLSDCTNLETLEIKSLEMNVSSDILSNCKLLKEVIIPTETFEYYSNHRVWSRYAFKLREPNWPRRIITKDNLRFVGNYPELSWTVYVSNPSESRNVIIPESLESLPVTVFGYKYSASAFENVIKLSLPSTITFIERNSFNNFTKLQSLTIHSEDPPAIEASFSSCTSLNFIHVPEDSISEYHSASFWRNYTQKTIGIGWPEQTVIEKGLKFEPSYEDKGWCVKAADTEITGEIIIPAEFKGWPVVKFNDEFQAAGFTGCTKVTSITIPDTFNSICEEAFKDCTSLTTVKIPSTIKNIGRLAFYDCESLTNVILPEGLKIISYRMFYNCSSLININIPSTIQEISGDAFVNCSSLTNIILPSKLTEIGSSAFRHCSKLQSVHVLSNDPPAANGKFFYDCDALSSIKVPAGTGVTYQNTSGWDNYKQIISEPEWPQPIIIKDGLTYEADYVNKGWIVSCDSLNSATDIEILSMLEGWPVITIKSNSFNNLQVLKTLTLPETIKEIKNSSISNCKSLEILYLNCVNPPDVEYSRALSSCDALQLIIVPDGSYSKYIKNSFWNKYNFSYKFPKIYENSWPRESIVENGIRYEFQSTSQSIKVFCDSKDIAGDIIIPDTINGFPVTQLNYGIFQDCVNLTSVKLPKNLYSISSYAFSGCINLESVEIPEDLQLIDRDAFSHCEKISSFNLPSKLKELEDGCFSSCKSLVRITIPQSVDKINDAIFFECDNLEEVILPDKVSEFGYKMFYNCIKLDNIFIPSGITELKYSTFEGCTNLVNIHLPQNIVKYGNKCFKDCTSLTNIPLTTALKEFGDECFKNCTGFNTIDFPDSLDTIGKSAFSSCSNLVSIDMPEKMTNIGQSAFYGCEKLEHIIIPSGITQLKRSTFENCSSLISVSLPEGLVLIESFAFDNCSNLLTLNLPYTLKSIENYGVRKCSNLSTVIVNNPEPISLLSHVFYYYCNINKIIVPKGTGEVYKSKWSSFKDFIVEAE